MTVIPWKVVGVMALGSVTIPLPAAAQQGLNTDIYGNPIYVQPAQPLPSRDPFGNQPVYIDPNTGFVVPRPPGADQPYPPAIQPPGLQTQPLPDGPYGQPQPQPPTNFGQPLPQPPSSYGQALPQPRQTYTPSPIPGQPAPDNAPYYRDETRTDPSPDELAEPRRADDLSLDDPADIADIPSGETATGVASIGGVDRAPQMSAELDELLRVGERYRAASPGFLEDLKKLAARYRDPLPATAPGPVDSASADDDAGNADADPDLDVADTGPVSRSIPSTGVSGVADVTPLDPGSVSFAYLEDYFTDGDLGSNPPWRQRQGEWIVDPVYGLRAQQPAETSDVPIRPKELLKSLLTGDASDADDDSVPTGAALIETPTTIGNAFSLAARITDHAGNGTAHFIVHQGGANWLGYRLELRSGPQPVIVLTRRGSNGYKDITKVAAPSFTVGKQHELRWARLSDGQMIVLLDGRPIITSRDTVFREDWTGFAFFNAGGDVSIRALRISAPVER